MRENISMKKWLIAIVLIILSSMGVACGKDPSISYAKTEICINFDETYTIDKDDIKIENSKDDCTISIIDTNIAELDGLKIIPKTKGSTTIRFELKDEGVYADIPLIVTHIIFATTAEVEMSSVVININELDEFYNKITLNEGCNEQPQISYDRNVIGYNYITGKIEPVAVGTTTVVVMFNSCNVSFSVVVIDKVYTTAIEVEDCTMFVGDSGEFEYSVFPAIANTFRFYSFSDKLQVLGNGQYVAVSAGEVDVFVEYWVEENTPVVKSFKVNIIEELESFDFSIMNEDGSACKYFLKEKNYKIIIPDVENVTSDAITISNNFAVDNIVINDNTIKISGTFVAVGEQSILVQINSNGNDIKVSHSYEVYQKTDLQIVAKWSAYTQQPYVDGKYHIKLEETADYPSYLKFILTLNGVTVSDSFKVYDITNNKTEISSTFRPAATGEYTICIEFMGENIGEIIIVVE